MHVTRLLFPVLVALPLAAGAAEPVRITTQMSGQLNAFPTVLERLGIGDYWDRPGLLPFSLTIDTIVDPDDALHWCDGNRCDSVPASVSYSLTIDGKTIGFADSNHVATISWSTSSFRNGTYYATEPHPSISGSFVSLAAWVNGAEGSIDADPFALQAPEGTALTGYLDLSLSVLDPEVPGFWTARGEADTVSFQVSAVPEPADTTMLLAGLGALGLAGRRKRVLTFQPA